MFTNSGRMFVGLCGLVLAGGSVMAGDEASTTGPVMFVRAEAKTVAPGEQFVVEVFVDRIEDLGVYQVQLSSKGEGRRGGFEVVDVQVDKVRPDFALSGGQVIAASDQKHKRAGALMMVGGAVISQPRYIATFTLEASDDARGAYEVNVKTGSETFMNDSTSVAMSFRVGEPIKLTVQPEVRKRTRKGSR